MKSFFIDTNVVLDFLTDRKPFSIQAEMLFHFQRRRMVNLYVSAISYNNIFYILNKLQGRKAAIKFLKELSGVADIIPLDQAIIDQALSSNFSDFEDAIQYYSALTVPEINGILTRNNKDFKKSELPVLSPEIAVKLISQE